MFFSLYGRIEYINFDKSSTHQQDNNVQLSIYKFLMLFSPWFALLLQFKCYLTFYKSQAETFDYHLYAWYLGSVWAVASHLNIILPPCQSIQQLSQTTRMQQIFSSFLFIYLEEITESFNLTPDQSRVILIKDILDESPNDETKL